MHILFLTDNFPPEVNAPASRTFEHCREWVRSGQKVTVITYAPNFPKGKLYPGYKNKLFQKEVIDGIEVIRVWTYIAANSGILRRMFDYISFMPAAVLTSFFVRKPDLVIGTSPQFFTACAAWCVGRLRRIPFIFELRDIWPESIKAVGAISAGLLLSLLERIEAFLYRRAAQIICVTDSFKTILIHRGIDAAKIRVVKNGVDLKRFAPIVKDKALLTELKIGNQFVIGYIGTHGLAHHLETILEVAKLSQDDQCNYVFLFVGAGAEKKKLKSKAANLELKNTRFIDNVSKDEICRYWSILDASIVHLKNEKLFHSVIPSKLFEAMAMGVPVLHGVCGESCELVKETGCGLTFEPENAADLFEKLKQLYNQPQKRAALSESCVTAAHQYDRKQQAALMLEHLCNTAFWPKNR